MLSNGGVFADFIEECKKENESTDEDRKKLETNIVNVNDIYNQEETDEFLNGDH